MKITVETIDTITQWEDKVQDSSIDDAIYGMVTCLFGATYPYESIISAMKNFVAEHEIHKHSNNL